MPTTEFAKKIEAGKINEYMKPSEAIDCPAGTEPDQVHNDEGY